MKSVLSLYCFILIFAVSSVAAAKAPSLDKLPGSVVNISKENTYPNPSNDTSELVPSAQTKELLRTPEVAIENPTLIKLLNESAIHPSKWSVGYRARICLGYWPLNYVSKETTVNWEYKKINDNAIDARGSETGQKLIYLQKNQARVSGGLTADVPKEHEVQKLIMAKAMKKTHLPISFSTIVGNGTKVERPYQVAPKKVGHLYGYVPAVNEKGKVAYGEVFIVMKGGRAGLEVKNIVQQGIGAWMPIQDHLSLRYIAR
ncbi:hypothetical protein EWH99_12735 [Sporolactobacillus sp. THM7-7]|nr:hypothetical protein EWH99_12735 [Sporolactobacillus sp. THM7-7]